MSEHEQIIEREQGRWQEAVYGALVEAIKKVPAEHSRTIDGAGCESGDPMDVTLSEVRMCIAAYDDWASAKETELASLKSELEDYKMLVRTIISRDAWFGRGDRSLGHKPYIAIGDAPGGGTPHEIELKDGLPIFTPALRSALKAAVEGGKA